MITNSCHSSFTIFVAVADVAAAAAAAVVVVGNVDVVVGIVVTRPPPIPIIPSEAFALASVAPPKSLPPPYSTAAA